MKITNIELIEVDVPYIAPIRNVGHADWEHTIARVHTDEGLIGLGEIWQPCRAVQPQADGLIGKDPLGMALERASEPWQCALYDIVAQAKGVPVWRLMGDKVRDEVPVAYWSPHLPPEETAREAERAAALGFTVHKLKAHPADIVRQAELIAEATAGVDYAIRVDPNCGFKYPTTAVRLARELTPYNIECFEDPVEKIAVNYAWYSLLRHKTDIPQALHLLDPYAVLCAVKADAVDCFNLSGNVALREAERRHRRDSGLPDLAADRGVVSRGSGRLLGASASDLDQRSAALRRTAIRARKRPDRGLAGIRFRTLCRAPWKWARDCAGRRRRRPLPDAVTIIGYGDGDGAPTASRFAK